MLITLWAEGAEEGGSKPRSKRARVEENTDIVVMGDGKSAGKSDDSESESEQLRDLLDGPPAIVQRRGSMGPGRSRNDVTLSSTALRGNSTQQLRGVSSLSVIRLKAQDSSRP